MKREMFATFAMALVAGTIVMAQIQRSEPAYRGKSATAWIKELGTAEASRRRAAERAIFVLGSNALPAVAKHLQARDSAIKLKLIDIFENVSFFDVGRASADHELGLEACRILGPAASPLVPQIIGFLNGTCRARAVRVLAAIGERAVQPLVNALTHEPWQAGAAVALGTIGCQPQIAIPALLERLKNADSETRTAASWAIGRFGEHAHLAVPQLSVLKEDPIFSVREQAKMALGRITSGSSPL